MWAYGLLVLAGSVLAVADDSSQGGPVAPPLVVSHAHHHIKHTSIKDSRAAQSNWAPSAAPGGAPGGAPGAPGPGAAPAAFGENWAADSHKEEFGNEYVAYTRRSLKSPDAFRDKKWLKEMRESPGDFDLDKDYTRDKRLRTMDSGAYSSKEPGATDDEDPRPPWKKSGSNSIIVSVSTLAVASAAMFF
eukprot:gnl/MRDRNA2_/MRDRNA2_103338_c0_seq1.p1 gnl/MRDRNA2_/MRDRNA2_103338_c0~~gnl/MRDRNA2_/MRDRNA2_103338_c0_seq1.p1  ORF type:complete len:189 (-),score=34.73 gnl/MRDRNA2_/MRDRNA2_103338_c0_seq1:4-570(-)